MTGHTVGTVVCRVLSRSVGGSELPADAREREGRERAKEEGRPVYPGERKEGEIERDEGFMLLVRRGADWGGIHIAVVPMGKKEIQGRKKDMVGERRGKEEGNGI